MSEVTPQNVTSKANSKNSSAVAEGIRNPDAVQEVLLKVGKWMEDNIRVLAGVIAILILAGIGFVVSQWLDNRAERRAQEAYYSIEAKYTKIRDEFDRARFAALAPNANSNAAVNAKQPTGDLEKDYGTIPSELEAFARENAKTSAGAQAAILAANLYLTYQQPDKAIEIAKIPATNLSDNRLLTNLAKVLWGSALADKGDCNEAIKIWGTVLENKAMTSLHGDVALRTGLCYEALNDTDKAREFYRKVVAHSDDTSAATTAKGLLRALEAKTPTTSNAQSSATGGNG